MEVIIKIENTMPNTQGKTKTDKDKNDGELGITVEFNNRLQHHPVSSIVTTSMSWRGTVVNTGYSCYLTAACRRWGHFFP